MIDIVTTMRREGHTNPPKSFQISSKYDAGI